MGWTFCKLARETRKFSIVTSLRDVRSAVAVLSYYYIASQQGRIKTTLNLPGR